MTGTRFCVWNAVGWNDLVETETNNFGDMHSVAMFGAAAESATVLHLCCVWVVATGWHGVSLNVV